MEINKLYHISEIPGISVFKPKPSPSKFENLNRDVVFAVTEKLLHNYLMPRDCPRVTYYPKHDTTAADMEKYIGSGKADFFVAVENTWYDRIKKAVLYCYEFRSDKFILLDEGAGYYVSYEEVVPVSERTIVDCQKEILERNIELRFTPSLKEFAEEIFGSSLQYSIIRLQNGGNSYRKL